MDISFLIVDEAVSNYLIFEKYDVVYEPDPIEAIDKVAKRRFDFVLAKKGYQEMDGLVFLTASLKLSPNTKTILLVDEVDDSYELKALKAGVDLVFKYDRDKNLLLEYIRSISVSKTSEISSAYIEIPEDDLKIYVDAYEVYKGEEKVPLTPREFEILVMLLRNKNVVIERRNFIESLWDESLFGVDERTIDVHIRRLREKLKTKSIVSVRGVGYKWSSKRL